MREDNLVIVKGSEGKNSKTGCKVKLGPDNEGPCVQGKGQS